MRAKTLRTWLDYLQSKGRLAVIDKPVRLKYEVAAIAKKLDGKQASYFTQVEDYSVPVVSGICSTREDFAEALETDLYGLIPKFTQAVASPIPCQLVDNNQAPVKQNITRENIDLMKLFPIPVHHDKDSGNYITAGLFIVRDPVTRKQNVSIHRLQVSGKDKLGALLLPRHTFHLYKQAEEAGRPLECAIVIGVDPATLLASQASTPFGVDELEIAGALRGEPLEVVRCETVDIDVPAFAEIVLEGKILPHVREPEGPFGEFPKYYGPRSDKEVVQITAVTHRNNPIFYTIVPAGYEHLLLGGIPREASLFQTIRQTVPTVKAVHMSPGGTCRYHAIVSIKKRNEGEAKNAIFAALANSFDIKHVVVVDEEVDIFDMEEVEWAIATRFQAQRDLVVVHGAQSSKLDPSTNEGVGSKMGLDCTVPLESEPMRYLRVAIPGYDSINLDEFVNPGNSKAVRFAEESS
ncbi:UbiD family decarboxylase [Brevibacillus agri]|uniref:UbiD family decarboxylase n=1 Tax=Brevibacillus agri TaxID=51101 RepID=UPI002E20238C|nr:UbiD family decarboxylase [Brevibacillus agri]MED1657219.1 UbiD family decarboxylase [Brevibacillus agri]MED1689616.1 UbiD family decarboxylase [Brevibacillus agri]MED1693902.1 UbiD family decarboxylase [Brevibacillus agri]MED1698278.1 UbiD family decarboxylase [Brevibacillus agri]